MHVLVPWHTHTHGGRTYADGTGVESILEQVSEGGSVDARRAAVYSLRNVLQRNPAEATASLATIGLHVLLQVLREREDVDMTVGALEALALAVGGQTQDKDGGSDAERMNSEMLTQDVSNVNLMLSLVAGDEFYVRYGALQLLSALSAGYSGFRLREQLLSWPNSVNLLIDMLSEREVLRNEALVMLVRLAGESTTGKSNAGAAGTAADGGINDGVQKMMVFGGIFEKLLAVIASEITGARDDEHQQIGISDSVVVGDSIELINHLIRDNVQNQTLFRESNHIGSVPLLLGVDAASASNHARGSLDDAAYVESMSKQQRVNLIRGLEMIALLTSTVSASNEHAKSNTFVNQKSLAGLGILPLLTRLSLDVPFVEDAACPFVRAAALTALGSLICNNGDTNAEFARAVVGVDYAGVGEPALNVVLRIALTSPHGDDAKAAVHVIRCFLHNNSEGQEFLIATMAPISISPSGDMADETNERAQSFGTMLVRALLGCNASGTSMRAEAGDVHASSRAAGVLATLLFNNVSAKERCLRTPIGVTDGGAADPVMLMPRLVTYMQEAPLAATEKRAASRHAQCIMMKVLVVWLHECPRAVRAFLSNPLNIPQIVDLISDSASSAMVGTQTHGSESDDDSDALVQGVAAAILGMCLVHYGDSSVGSGVEHGASGGTDLMTALDVMTSRIGLTRFLKKFETLFALPACSSLGTSDTAGYGIGDVSGMYERALSVTPTAQSVGELPVMDEQLYTLLLGLRATLNDRVVALYSKPASDSDADEAARLGAAVGSFDPRLDPRVQYERLMTLLEESRSEIRDLRMRNKILAEEVTSGGGGGGGGGAGCSVGETQPDGHAHERGAYIAESVSANGHHQPVHDDGGGAKSLERNEAQIKAIAKASEAEADAERARRAEHAAREEALQARVELDAQIVAANDARDAVQRSEMDLQALSESYNSLESQMSDLLLCLREEAKCFSIEAAKCMAFEEELTSLGVDVALIVARATAENEENEGE